MRPRLVSAAVCLALLTPALMATPASARKAAPAAAEASALVPFASAESMTRLERSRHKVDFFKLANHFEGQIHKGNCGPTTATIVLNTLRADAGPEGKPVDKSGVPEPIAAGLAKRFDPFFERYSQRLFLADPRVAAVKSEAVFFGQPAKPGAKSDFGLQLRQLHDMLTALGLDSTLRVVADDAREAALKQELIANLGRADDYVIVNYRRPALGQQGGGHISPLGAYDAGSDSFLILDVNPNGKTWVWVPSAALFAAMRTFDTRENRGFLLVREGGEGR